MGRAPLASLFGISVIMSSIALGVTIGKDIAKTRIADEMARQQVAAENAAGLAAMRDVEARQEQIRQERLRWIESLGKE